MKKLLLSFVTFILTTTSMAQTWEKMQWFNEPENWEIKDGALIMDVMPHS